MAYSFKGYTGDGSTRIFQVTFPFLRKEHVKVFINGVEIYSSQLEWLTEGAIQLASAPEAGASVLLRRDTPKEAAEVDFKDGSTLRERDLDRQVLQTLYISQEAYDALSTALALSETTGHYDASGRRIANIADPVYPQDVATKSYADRFVVGAQAQVDAATSLRNATAQLKSDTDALRVATEAVKAATETSAAIKVTEATTQADRATSEANRARTEADRAVTEADRSKAQADRSVTEADRAKSEADRASSNAGTVSAQVAAAKSEILSAAAYVPIGMEATFPVNSIPPGWLIEMGQTIYREAYPELVTYLTNDPNAASAVLPDMRGEFARGADLGRGIDTGRAVGSSQSDAMRNIVGEFSTKVQVRDVKNVNYAVSGAFKTSPNGYYSNGVEGHGNFYTPSNVMFDASLVVPTASEFRPRNIAKVWCIKAYHAPMSAQPVDLTNILTQLNSTSANITAHNNDVNAHAAAIKAMLNVTGEAPMFAVRAWVAFNSSGVIAGGGNISSVVRNGVGDMTVNMTKALPSANYAVLAFTQHYTGAGGADLSGVFLYPSVNRTTTSFRLWCQTDNTGSAQDAPIYFAIVVG